MVPGVQIMIPQWVGCRRLSMRSRSACVRALPPGHRSTASTSTSNHPAPDSTEP